MTLEMSNAMIQTQRRSPGAAPSHAVARVSNILRQVSFSRMLPWSAAVRKGGTDGVSRKGQLKQNGPSGPDIATDLQ